MYNLFTAALILMITFTATIRRKYMNSYERFNTILDGKKPDKMPFYYTAVSCSVASQILGREVHTGADSLHFKEELSWLGGKNAHDEFVHKYQEDTLELHRKLKADVIREAWRCRGKPTKKLDDYTLLFGEENGPHIIKRFFPEYQSYGIVEDSAKKLSDTDELKEQLLSEMKQDHKVTEDELYNIYKDQLTLKKMAEPYFPAFINGLGLFFPMENVVWLEATAAEPELLRDYYLYQAEILVQHVKWLHEQGYRFISAGSDIASNTGPIISPNAFRTIFVPALKKLSDECRKYGMFYCYRTDGNIWSISDYMFNEAGVQAYGEVDRAASMTVASLRQKYPGIIIVGNVSSATLNTGTIEEVRKMTRESLEESDGYNYFPGPSNAIMHGTKLENIYAMLEEIENYRP
jgi:hypothetical protein